MPHNNGVLTASLLLIACLGLNMVAFPEVWKMFRDDSAPTISAAPKPLPPSEPPKPPPTRTVSVDRPIPVDPPPAKKEEPPKESPLPPETPPKKEDPAPKPPPNKEEPAPETPPKKEEPVPNATPAPQTPPKKEDPVPEIPPTKEAETKEAEAKEHRLKGADPSAFAPVFSVENKELEHRESLLPSPEAVDPFLSAVQKGSPDVPASAYAEEFKPMLKEDPKRVEPMFETIDSILSQPIVYESRPTIKQRVEGARKIVPLPSATSLTSVSPTGPVKRLPPTD